MWLLGFELRNSRKAAGTLKAEPFLQPINVFLFVLVFRDRVSLYSSDCPGTHFVDQAGLELRNLPASASLMLGLKACATTPGLRERETLYGRICHLCKPRHI